MVATFFEKPDGHMAQTPAQTTMSEAHALPHPFNFTFIHLREKAAYDEGIKLLGKVATVRAMPGVSGGGVGAG